MMSPMAVHLNPAFFEDPLDFNPWRWLVSDKLTPNYCYQFLYICITKILTIPEMQDESKRNAQKNFVPFGLGTRACPAAEFSKLFIALFLHVLVTKYRLLLAHDKSIYTFVMLAAL